jgi:hypothetical protein
MSTNDIVRDSIKSMFKRRSREFYLRNPLETGNLVHGMHQALGEALTSYLIETGVNRREVLGKAFEMAGWVPGLVQVSSLDNLLEIMWDNSEQRVLEHETYFALVSDHTGYSYAKEFAAKFQSLIPLARKKDNAVNGITKSVSLSGENILNEALLRMHVGEAFSGRDDLTQAYTVQFAIAVGALTGVAIQANCPEKFAYLVEERLIQRFQDMATENGWVKSQVDLVFGEYVH